MNDNVILARFGIDLESVISDAAKFKQALDEARASLNEMRKSDEATTEQIVRQEAVVKSLSEAYRQSSRVLTATEKVNNDLITGEERINKLLTTQAGSIEALRLQNAELNKVRNTLDIETQGDLIEQLNRKIEANTEVIRENSDTVTQQKMNIGNYSGGILDAIGSLEAFGLKVPPVFGKVVKSTKSMGASGKSLGESLMGATKSLGALTVAGVKFMLTPIGAVVSTLAVAFIAITTAINRNEDSVNRLKEAFAPLTRLFSLIMDALGELGDVYIAKITKQIELLEKGLISSFQAIAKALDFLGFDEQAENLRNFTDRMEENIQKAKEYERTKARIVTLERENKIANAEIEAEMRGLQRIINDTSKSYAEREEAVKKANELEKQVIKNNIELTRLQLQTTREQIRLQGRKTELLNEEADLIARLKTLESDLTESELDSEEKINDLRKRASDDEKARRDKLADDARRRRDEALREQERQISLRLQNLNEELEAIQVNAGWRAKTLQEELADFESTSKKRLEILNTELEAGRISRLKYDNEIAKLDNERAKRQAEISVQALELELAQQNEARRQIIEDDRYLSEQRFAEIQKSYAERLEAEKEFLKQRFENGLISELEYEQELREMQIKFEEENEALRFVREENRKQEELDRRALEFEERLELMRQENETEFEIRRAMLNEQHALELEDLEELYANQLISQEEYNLRSLQLEKDRAKGMEEIKKAERDMTLDLTNGMLSAISGAIDENSKVAKGISLAMAAINLQEAITKNLALGFPQNIIAIARDTAVGLQAIRRITSTKIPSAGSGGGAPGGGGGVSVPSNFSTGYNVNMDSTTARQLEREINIDTEALADGVAEGARRGIVDLTTNRNIQNGATF